RPLLHRPRTSASRRTRPTLLSNQNQAAATGIILITLLLCAYFLEQGSMALLAHALFSGTTNATVALPGSGHIHVRRAAKTNETIVTRNIFGPDVSLVPLEAADVELGEDGELVIGDDGGAITRCDGNLRLVAAVVNPKNTAMSVAGLTEGTEKATLYREGMTVGGRTIVAISPHRVIFHASGGRLCEIPMWRPDQAPPPARPVPTTVAEAVQQASEASTA